MQKGSDNRLPVDICWRWREFGMIGGAEMHEILALRQRVFVVEQGCAYLDADGYDEHSHHLTGRNPAAELAAYARLTPPGSRFAEPSIGRLLTARSCRRQGLAGKALSCAIAKSFELYPGRSIRISAQLYLESFYARYGFAAEGHSYLEDGIEHIDMMLRAGK